MAAVTTSAYKDISSNEYWVNDEVWVKSVYDFSADAGAETDTYVLCSLPVGYVIVDGYAHVTTEIDSAGDACTVEIGYTGSTAAVIAQTAEASLVEDAVIALAAKQIVTSNNDIYMTIGTEAITSGVLELHLKVKKAN